MELAVTDWKIRVIWVMTVCQWGYRSQIFEDPFHLQGEAVSSQVAWPWKWRH